MKATAKPFLKWAGGKKQLIAELDKRLPLELKNGRIKKYIEPFVGAGALLFHIHNNYQVDEYIICDINKELFVCYQSIKSAPSLVINNLETIKEEYFGLDMEKRSEYFYYIRTQYNMEMLNFGYSEYNSEWAHRTAQTIFLNRTCFNGLFRVNSKGQFNVPFGKHSNPYIYDVDNILAVSNVLEHATILNGDFEITKPYIDEDSFVYLDPPYRPLNTSSSFTSYNKDTFDDSGQQRLADFYSEMSKRNNAKLMLSNSDPKNTNIEDHFFENLFKGFGIDRVLATRMINCQGQKRGSISELIVLNY